MVNKKIWIIFASILSVALLVSTSVGVAIKADIRVKKQLQIDSSISSDSGRIGLEEKAKPEIEITSDSSSDYITSLIDSDIAITETDDDSDEPSASSISGTEINSDESESSESVVSETDITNEGDSSEPGDDLIWIAVNGDEIPNEDGGNPDFDTDESGDSSNPTLSSDLSGSFAPAPIEVDEVFVVTDSGLVEKDAAIDSTLSLNILGHAEIEVLSGSSNLLSKPYFKGLDILDRLSLTIASASMIFLVRAIQALDVVFPLADATIIAAAVLTMVINGTIYAIHHGLSILDSIIDITNVIVITINGVEHEFQLPGLIKDIIKSLISQFFRALEYLTSNISEYLALLADQSIDHLINFLEGLRDLILNQESLGIITNLYQNAPAAVFALLEVIKSKDTDALRDYFGNIGLSNSQINNMISLLTASDSLFVNIRNGIFGKFDIFMTNGRASTPLRDICAQINPYYQAPEGGYAAVIKIKAISAGHVFDSKIIGIIYESSDNGALGSSESLFAESSTMFGSTTSSGSSTSYGSTEMGSTTENSGLQ